MWVGENNFNTIVHERTVDIYIPFHAAAIFHQPNTVHIMGQGFFASQLCTHHTESWVKTSHCSLVYGTNLVYKLFSVYFIILYSWLSGMHTRQSAVQNNKYQVSHKYSWSSWWWTWRDLRHVEVVNKIDKIL